MTIELWGFIIGAVITQAGICLGHWIANWRD